MPWKPFTCPKPSVRGSGLQFGHGGDAVETMRSARRWSPGTSFNSATALMPWRLELDRQLLAGHLASIRRPPGGRGNERRAPWPRAGQVGFNSVTAVMPWKRGRAADVEREE